jgi:hypothetical protein
LVLVLGILGSLVVEATLAEGMDWSRGLGLAYPSSFLSAIVAMVGFVQELVVLVAPRKLLVSNSGGDALFAASEYSRSYLWTACLMLVESGGRWLGRMYPMWSETAAR